ncbi:MAG TPA: hypothetical protein PKN56_03145 [Leptospiraceae bacterium]|nr:hypothetical protein [Leptospiraceae bacterium]HNI94830.1 hypothetical protein [Leptospiraceae bacterium]HNN02532.1 hypothetical protein [Leptospiraceae bacterium]
MKPAQNPKDESEFKSFVESMDKETDVRLFRVSKSMVNLSNISISLEEKVSRLDSLVKSSAE